MPNLPCFLCGKELEQRTDKNKKPYFICDPCGVQMFVRGRQGIEKLHTLIGALKHHALVIEAHSEALFEIRAILDELAGVEAELRKLDAFSLLTRNKTKEKARKILQQRLEKLLERLQHVAIASAD